MKILLLFSLGTANKITPAAAKPQSADQIVVALQNGNIFEASLVGSDNLTDLAVLKIRANNLSTIPQNSNRQAHVGDVVLAIGNPYNLGQSVSQGIITALRPTALIIP